jgi:hypothetical protein
MKIEKLAIQMIVMVITFSFVSCKKENGESDNDFKMLFYGIWKNENNVIRELSSNKLEVQSSEWSFTLTISSWTAVSNTNEETKTEYPNGYKISGTITQMFRGPLGSDVYEGGVPDIGEYYSEIYYLNVNKGCFIVYSPFGFVANPISSSIYIKHGSKSMYPISPKLLNVDTEGIIKTGIKIYNTNGNLVKSKSRQSPAPN